MEEFVDDIKCYQTCLRNENKNKRTKLYNKLISEEKKLYEISRFFIFDFEKTISMFIGSLIDATTTAQSHGSSTEFRNLFDEFAEINFKYLLRQLKTRYKIIFIDPTRVRDWEISTIP